MSSNRTLKDGWRWVRFGDVVHNVKVTTKDPAEEGLTRVVGLAHLDSDSLPLRRWDELGDLGDGTSFTRVFRAGQVLFGKRRAYQRKVAVADFDGICSSDILVFEPSTAELLPDFLPYLVQSDGFFAHALGTSAGSLSPRTKFKELAKYEFSLPPVREQLATLELLALLRAEQDGVRSAELQARSLESGLLASLASSPHAKVTELRDVLTTRAQGVQVGPFGGSLSSRFFSKNGVAILKINNITENGDLDLREVVRTSDSRASTLERYRVQAGDVVTAAQATIGRSALVTPEAEGALISQHLIRVRVDPDTFRPELLAALFNNRFVVRQMEAVKTKTTRDGLNTADVEAFQIPLAPVSLQDRILDELRKLAAVADGISRQLQTMVSLRKAIVADSLGNDR